MGGEFFAGEIFHEEFSAGETFNWGKVFSTGGRISGIIWKQSEKNNKSLNESRLSRVFQAQSSAGNFLGVEYFTRE